MQTNLQTQSAAVLGTEGRKQSFKNKAQMQIAALASLLEFRCILQAQPGPTTARAWADVPTADGCAGLTCCSPPSPRLLPFRGRSSVPMAVSSAGAVSPHSVPLRSPAAWPELQPARRRPALPRSARSFAVLTAEMEPGGPCQGVVACGLGTVTPYCCGHLPKPLCTPRRGPWPVPAALINHVLAKRLCCFSCCGKV